MEQTTASIAQAARNAGLQVTGWLSSREIAAVIRTAYDPKALAALQQWSETGRAEADPAAAGPVVQVEEYDRIATDSARHATYWVENWPRTEIGAGFLHGLMFTAGVRRSLSLIYVPQGSSPRCGTSSARRPRSSPTPTNAPAGDRSTARKTPSSTPTSKPANASSSPGTPTWP